MKWEYIKQKESRYAYKKIRVTIDAEEIKIWVDRCINERPIQPIGISI